MFEFIVSGDSMWRRAGRADESNKHLTYVNLTTWRRRCGTPVTAPLPRSHVALMFFFRGIEIKLLHLLSLIFYKKCDRKNFWFLWFSKTKNSQLLPVYYLINKTINQSSSWRQKNKESVTLEWTWDELLSKAELLFFKFFHLERINDFK